MPPEPAAAWDGLRSAAQLLLPAEQLAAMIDTPEAGKVAEKLARVVVDPLVAVPNAHMGDNTTWNGHAHWLAADRHTGSTSF
jgi:hypothetical protein